MKNEILLVNPYIHDFAAYDLWAKPLGLYWLSAYLEQHGYQTTLVDCLDRFSRPWLQQQGRKRPKGSRYGHGPFPYTIITKPEIYAPVLRYYRRFGIPVELFREMLRQVPRPEAIMVGSMMTYWYRGVFETIAILREEFPGVPLALGGVYATICCDHARRLSGADIVISGTGEAKAVEWLDQLSGRQHDLADVGLPDAADLPMPAHRFLSPGSPAVIATSLGCPLRCAYCASRLLQPVFRQRPPSQVIAEICYLRRRLRVANIAFYDDALLIDADNHLVPILQAVIEISQSLHLHTPNGIHSRPITLELAKLLYQARVQTIRLSYERRAIYSADSQASIVDEDLARAVSYLQAAGYGRNPKIEAYVKIGLPGQTPEEITEAFAFVHQLGVHICISDYSPVPGTPTFQDSMNRYHLDPEEPLYQNNTALHYFTGYVTPDLLQQLKSLVATLNFALERGINLSNNSHLSRLFLNAQKALPRS